MFRIGLFLVGCACFTASATCAYLAWSVETPELACAEPVHDFGELSYGETARAEFRLVNRYEQPLAIKGVRKGRGCSDVVLSTTTVPPGETLKVDAGWRMNEARGALVARLWVVYALPDGRSDAVELQMVANVVPDVVVDPGAIRFPPQQKGSQTVTLRPGRMQAFTVGHVSCTHYAFRATRPGAENDIVVTFDGTELTSQPDQPVAYLLISTNSPHQPTLSIPIHLGSE